MTAAGIAFQCLWADEQLAAVFLDLADHGDLGPCPCSWFWVVAKAYEGELVPNDLAARTYSLVSTALGMGVAS